VARGCGVKGFSDLPRRSGRWLCKGRGACLEWGSRSC